MNKWQQFLNQNAPQLNKLAISDVGKTSFIAPLSDLGLIAFSGEEAAHFLHNQLTNDIEHLGMTETRLAGYCSPKGRLLATMLVWKTSDAIMLQLPYELLPAIQKRLQMFVMRAKAKSADVSEQHVILGLAGESTTTAISKWFGAMPSAPYSTVTSDAGTLIRMADAFGAPRYLWITTTDFAVASWPELIQVLTPADASTWRLTDIHAGIPQVTLATQEKFVPQMINFEVVGGVNFKKGCYPGQEIVARSQYLGKLKRRMMLATIETQDATAGMDVFSSEDPEQPCGMIVNVERSSLNQMDCLVEIKTASTESSSIHLGSAQGPTLKFQALPYPLPDSE
jgi:tRNA-modifying protein YgfZ